MTILQTRVGNLDMDRNIGYLTLDLESLSGLEVRHSDYKQLDTISKNVNMRVGKIEKQDKKVAKTALMGIHSVLEGMGYDKYDYYHRKSLSTGLRDKELDCDERSLIYLSVAEKLNWPLYGVKWPQHVNVRWDNRRSNFLWETLNGEISDIKSVSIVPSSKALRKGIYGKNLSRQETLAIILYGIAQELRTKGHFDKALSYLTEAIRLKPNYDEAYASRGAMKGGMQNFEGCIRDSNKALRLEPLNITAIDNRGLARFHLSRYRLAIRDFQKVVEHRRDPLTKRYIGLAKINLGDGKGLKEVEDAERELQINDEYSR